MNSKRKLTALLACLLSLALLTACGQRVETVPAAEPMPTPAAAPPAPVPSEAEQRRILEENRALWAFDEGQYAPDWFYTFTDLDRNGLLEVLSASTQGTGIFTYAHYYEVMADGSGLKNLYHADAEIEGPDDWPEIIMNALDCYYDAAADRYYYPCEGITRDGAAHQYFAWYALSLKDGVADWERLADKSVDWDENGAEHVACRNAAGEPISAQDYDSAPERRFAGLEKSTLALDWTAVRAPEPEPTPEPTPAPTPVPSGPPVVITKNPSSEALTVGGKTWFIAHADNAASLTWEIVAPDGKVYSLAEAMALHPGLSLEALEGDTVAVSGVPLSLNGWGVRARFDGPGGSACTDAAAIYVGDYVGAYGQVIQAYKTAYESGNTTMEYAFANELSEFIVGSSHVGYAFKDIDKDGTPELVIADTDPNAGKVLFALYTLSDGAPKRLALSTARDRYFLRSDNTVLNEASGGAAYSYRFLLRKSGDALAGFEGVITSPAAEDQASVKFYAQTGDTAYEPRSVDREISEEEYAAKWETYRSKIYLPQLTRIA